jgi:hypothetical protein
VSIVLTAAGGSRDSIVSLEARNINALDNPVLGKIAKFPDDLAVLEV